MDSKKKPAGFNDRQKKLKLFSDNQKKWKALIKKEDTFVEGKNILLENHALIHDKKVYGASDATIYDLLWENLKPETCKIISKQGTSVLKMLDNFSLSLPTFYAQNRFMIFIFVQIIL